MRHIDISKLDNLLSNIAAGEEVEVAHVRKDGADVAIVLSPERYLELLMKDVPPKRAARDS